MSQLLVLRNDCKHPGPGKEEVCDPDQTSPGFRANAILAFSSLQLTRYRWKKPDGEQFAQEMHRRVLKIEGKICSLRRAFTKSIAEQAASDNTDAPAGGHFPNRLSNVQDNRGVGIKAGVRGSEGRSALDHGSEREPLSRYRKTAVRTRGSGVQRA